jgi:hypothetical protein
MTRRDWQGGFPAGVDTVAACALVILDLTDAGLRRWFDDHALTAVAGLLLVLMITVLVVDRVLRQRQCNSRICAVDRRAGTDIYAQMSRNFLEQAQRLAGERASAPCVLATKSGREAARPPCSMTRFSAQVRVDLAAP